MKAALHVPQLDGWRGVAIALVLLGHFGGDVIFPWLSSLGVDFFFVLSGRLMAEILFVRQESFPAFFARRFVRVYPTLLMFVLISGCIAWGTPLAYGANTALAALSFTLNYGVASGLLPFSILDHIWSLCVEEHSYILLALMALVSRRIAWPSAGITITLIGAAALANGVVRLDILHGDAIQTFWRTDVAMAGIFLSAGLYLLFRKQGSARYYYVWISPVALAGSLLAQAFGQHALIYSGLKIILLAVAVNAIEISPRIVGELLESQMFRLLGRCSFSLYLWQEPFFQLAVQNFLSPLVALALAMVAGVMGFMGIEHPLRSILGRMFSKPISFAKILPQKGI